METLQDYGTKSSTGEVSTQTGLHRRALTNVHALEAAWTREEKGVIGRVQKQGLCNLGINW